MPPQRNVLFSILIFPLVSLSLPSFSLRAMLPVVFEECIFKLSEAQCGHASRLPEILGQRPTPPQGRKSISFPPLNRQHYCSTGA